MRVLGKAVWKVGWRHRLSTHEPIRSYYVLMSEGTEEDAYPTDADVDAVIAEFDGDPRATVRALLHDLDLLARDYEAKVSRGYVRGTLPWQRSA
jgi:hypothetical protein